jgi:hypothetical protein
MLKRPELFQNGFHLSYFPLGEKVRKLVDQNAWEEIDLEFKQLTTSEGALYKFLKQFHEFSVIEFIISIRDAENEWEEDGIWHDDGSRIFAFSLSLTTDPDSLEGGRLGIRRKGEERMRLLPTPSMGGIILFLTGLYGFEHKTHKVTQGRRVIIAGWCS